MTPSERAELDVLRVLDGDDADEERYEQLAERIGGPSEADTIH